jgi:ribonucleotide monophosphatase NagD (HAD superfamily)
MMTISKFEGVFLFDFDDTLFLKKSRVFIPHIMKLLKETQKHSVPVMIVTCNKKAKDILVEHKIEGFFTDILHVDIKFEFKSDKIRRGILPRYPPEKIFFFDNDPFHVYDVSQSCNIRSFLVNPDIGIRQEIVFLLMSYRFDDLRIFLNRGLQGSIRSTSYGSDTLMMEKCISLQNLMELDKMNVIGPNDKS